MKYVVIGNGILALSTAFKLLKNSGAQDEIIIIGPNDRVGSATLAAAAMQNSFAEIGAHSLKTKEDLFHFELSRLATKLWPDFEKELDESIKDNSETFKRPPFNNNSALDKGTFVLNNTASDQLDDKNFNAILDALMEFDEQHELVDPKDIPNYYPSQSKRATKAIYIDNEGWLNPRLILEKLDKIMLNDSRVTVYDCKAKSIKSINGEVAYVVLENDIEVCGDEYLLAAGAPTRNLIEDSNLDLDIIDMFYGVGVSLEVVSPGYPHEKCIRTPNRGGACGVYTVPLNLGVNGAKDHIVIGASNYLSPTPVYHGRLISIEHLMKSAVEEVNGYFYNAQLVRTNVGWRPTTQDTYPLIGRTSITNLTIATGTKRDGFHMSPALSRDIAKIVMKEAVDDRYAYFQPERELIKNIDRASGIEMVVESLMSEQYQHGYIPSNILMNEQVKNTYRQDIEKLHDKVGATDWAIPPELVNMYRRGFARLK